jgi:hypothetical protein
MYKRDCTALSHEIRTPSVKAVGILLVFLQLALLGVACRKPEPVREVRKGAFWTVIGGPNRTPRTR